MVFSKIFCFLGKNAGNAFKGDDFVNAAFSLITGNQLVPFKMCLMTTAGTIVNLS